MFEIHHYTIGHRLSGILDEGVVRPATAGVPRGEKPVVWFSSHNFFEPTARKMERTTVADITQPRVRLMSVRDMHERGGGVFRLTVDADDDALMRELGICDYRVLKIQAKISKRHRVKMAKSARQQGSKPSNWWGTIKPVHVVQCKLEQLVDVGTRLEWRSA